MKTMHLVALGVGASVFGLCPADATHSWNGYHWAVISPGVTLNVNTSIATKWNAAVGGAIYDWNKPSQDKLTLTSKTVTVDPKKCNPISGQILVCNAAYGKQGWLGIATIWLKSGTKHITQATTKLNDSYHDSVPYNSPAWRSLVACQEIGHNFGLDHQDEIFSNQNLGTCMDYTDKPAGNEHPNAHDYEQLYNMYNHNDGFTTATAGTNFNIRQVGKPVPERPPSEGIGDSPAQWGQAIHTDMQGRPDVFLKEFSDGQRAVTHVFWAPGARPQ